jgi:acetyl-CoA carboxylase biotin carboxyl carrier protein
MSTEAGDAVLAALRALLPELEAGGVTELDVSVGDARLYLRRRPGHTAAVSFSAASALESESVPDEGLVAIVTPLSGVIYIQPSPDEPAFVHEGDMVEAGQVVALVEAMKVFNEIHAEVAGMVVRLNVTPGQLVQSGQTLMELRPAAGETANGEAV